MVSNTNNRVGTDSSEGKKSTDQKKCPGCKGPYNIIDETCLACMKRQHYYLYNTLEGMKFIYNEEKQRDSKGD